METNPILNPTIGRRSFSRVLRGVLYAAVLLAVGLVFMLVIASSNTAFLDEHYTWLVWATLGLSAILLVLVIELVRRLVRRHRAGVFGTRLTIRLAWALILMTLIPASFIYLISVQVLGRSIESWFDVPVDRALESGLTLARAAVDSQMMDVTAKTRRVEAELAEGTQAQWQQSLDRAREQLGLQDVAIITFNGRILAASGSQFTRLIGDIPSANILRQLRTAKQTALIEGGEGTDRSLRIRALRLLANNQPGEEPRFLQVIQTLPTSLAENAEAVQKGQRDYQELSLARQGLKRIYRATLTLSLLLTLFSAIAAAFLLAGWLTGPLTQLAYATKAIAAGDFRPMKDYAGRDELGTLTESFNLMARQLGEAQQQVSQQRDELLEANLKLEGVLTSISVAVILLDQNFQVELANGPARALMQDPQADVFGDFRSNRVSLQIPIEQIHWLGQFAPMIRTNFHGQADMEHLLEDSWEEQYEIVAETRPGQNTPMSRSMGGASSQVWLVRGARLVIEAAEVNYLLVFEDITTRLSAQRATAWAEVARRLAHEIKNPLTPIQLAAERLEQKLVPKLGSADVQLVQRSTQTIVNQVSALKQMVDEFREYARLPSAQLQPVRLADLVQEVMDLYPELHDGIRIRTRYDRSTPMVMGDPGQLRQVIHNLVKNAREALENTADGQIEICIDALRTVRKEKSGTQADLNRQPLVADAKSLVEVERRVSNVTAVRLVVIDNGPGFAREIQQREFEPYVTTKPKGTGLGLAIVKKIVDDHGAKIALENLEDLNFEEGLRFDANLVSKVNEPSDTAKFAHGARVTVVFTHLYDLRAGAKPPTAQKSA